MSSAVTIELGPSGSATDITDLVKWDTLKYTDDGSGAGGVTFRIEGDLTDVPDLVDQALVTVSETFTGHELVLARVVGIRAISTPGRDTVEVIAEGLGGLIDKTYLRTEARSAETAIVRLTALWDAYAPDPLDKTDHAYITVSANLPAQTYEGISLREAIQQVLAQASETAEFYIDSAGRLHAFTSETNPAPANIDADSPGAGEILPEELTVEYDSKQYANRVFIQGSAPIASGYFEDAAAIAAADGMEVTHVVQAQDCDSAAEAQQVADAYLERSTTHVTRGSFTVTGVADPVLSWADMMDTLNPLAWWRLGETVIDDGLPAADASGNGYTGAYEEGGFTIGVIAGLVLGDTNGAARFPGHDSGYMQSPTLAALGTAYSMAAWIKPDRSGVSEIFLAGGTLRPYLIRNTVGGIGFVFTNSAAGQTTALTAAAAAPQDVATFVVATHDGTTARVYINGVLAATSATASAAPGAIAFKVGRWGTAGLPFDGTVDEPAVWNSALSAANVAALYAGSTANRRDGWRAGQNVAITSSKHSLAGLTFRIHRVQGSFIRATASPIRRYQVEFGAPRASQSAAQQRLEAALARRITSDQLGVSGLFTVTTDGLIVSDSA